MAQNGTRTLVEVGRAATRQFDGTGLAIGTLVVVAAMVSIALWGLHVPSIAAAAAAYGFAFGLTVLIVYGIETAGTRFRWQFVDRASARNLPRWWGSPVLPFAALVLGLLFGHFVW